MDQVGILTVHGNASGMDGPRDGPRACFAARAADVWVPV